MQTLGEELISNERVALVELVKNSYDADAGLVVIRFVGPLEKGKGAVEVWDDGHGMRPETVQGSWMEVATSHRQRAPRSESGTRRVLGAKGIGRFASARLAREVSVVTRREDGVETEVLVDWDAFTKEDVYLDDVAIHWTSREATVFDIDGEAQRLFRAVSEAATRGALGKERAAAIEAVQTQGRTPHGTVVRLRELRQQWTETSIDQLWYALSRLVPPAPSAELDVPDRPEFSIYLDVPAPFEHRTGFVRAREALARPDYRLVGSIDAEGHAELVYRASRGSEDVQIVRDLRVKGHAPSCGPLKIDLRAWDLDAPSLRKLTQVDLGAKNVTELRALIRANSGVALYRDGFRVQPFGEPEFDWLILDQRRVNNPTMRLSNNQLMGFVYISADHNPGLQDRSHREGLIDSPAFEDLKALMLDCANELETRRYKLRRAERVSDDAPGSPAERERGHGIFDAFTLDPLRGIVSQKYPDDLELGRALDAATESLRENVEKVQEVLSRFSRLASLGALVDVILHDGRTALTKIAFLLGELEEAVDSVAVSDPLLSQALSKMQAGFTAQSDALDKLFSRIEPLSGRRRETPRKISLQSAIRDGVSVHEEVLKKAGITVKVIGQDEVITAEPSDIITVIVNLVGNSIYWMSTLPEDADRNIAIHTSRDGEDAVTILVSDSGPGVREEIRELIFDTYFSDKPDGVGLGLSIAGTIVEDFYNGDLALMSSGPLSGACFRIRLRRRLG
ncbi:ATP-binding protein [Kitasatospora sp. GP82]|uniref:sensor histidine kinase n=1 Tax=Kitasatospora sp. GP82 TaxID=3035089 RepID=UPI002475F5E4|nr:ATP-binding protein [Kitasatospora sp. GP82]MDH6123640.1 signal transduction histidine kinase [Kitasatospora sp. GP82]